MGGGCNIMGAFSGGGGGSNLSSSQTYITSDFTSSSTSFTDITDLKADMPDVTNGKGFVICNMTYSISSGGNQCVFQILNEANTVQGSQGYENADANVLHCAQVQAIHDTDGEEMQMSGRVSAGSWTIGANSTTKKTNIITMGL